MHGKRWCQLNRLQRRRPNCCRLWSHWLWCWIGHSLLWSCYSHTLVFLEFVRQSIFAVGMSFYNNVQSPCVWPWPRVVSSKRLFWLILQWFNGRLTIYLGFPLGILIDSFLVFPIAQPFAGLESWPPSWERNLWVWQLTHFVDQVLLNFHEWMFHFLTFFCLVDGKARGLHEGTSVRVKWQSCEHVAWFHQQTGNASTLGLALVVWLGSISIPCLLVKIFIPMLDVWAQTFCNKLRAYYLSFDSLIPKNQIKMGPRARAVNQSILKPFRRARADPSWKGSGSILKTFSTLSDLAVCWKCGRWDHSYTHDCGSALGGRWFFNLIGCISIQWSASVIHTNSFVMWKQLQRFPEGFAWRVDQRKT